MSSDHRLIFMLGTSLLFCPVLDAIAQSQSAITIAIAEPDLTTTSAAVSSRVAPAIANAQWILPATALNLIHEAVQVTTDQLQAAIDDGTIKAVDLVVKASDLAIKTAMPYEATALTFTGNIMLGSKSNQQLVDAAGACYSLSLSAQAIPMGLVPDRVAICSLDTTQLADALASSQNGSSASQLVQGGVWATADDPIGYTYGQMEPSVITTSKSSYRPGERILNYFLSCSVYDFSQGSFVPYNDCPIEISWNVEESSGSHAHGGSRPRGRVVVPARGGLSKVQDFYNTPDYGVSPASAGEVVPPVVGDSFLSVRTAVDDSRITYSYIAPESSGTTHLSVVGFKGTRYSPLTINSDLDVFIAGLYGRGGYVGYNGGRWSMKPNSAPAHNEQNYYATQALLGRLDNVASSYQDIYRTITGRDTQGIFINDMSLPSGGLFDFRGTYKPPHASHRRGEAADIGINNHGYSNLQIQIIASRIAANGLQQPETAASSRTCPITYDVTGPHGCTANHFHVEIDEAQIRNDENANIE